MPQKAFYPLKRTLNGELILPGDKSISHRALMLAGISRGSAIIKNLSTGKDVLSTLDCMNALGCSIEQLNATEFLIQGISPLQSPKLSLDCGNSGTTIRLLSGLLSGANINAVLTGDSSLCKRPMKRIITPLIKMGAYIKAIGENDSAPIEISHSEKGLHGIDYCLPIASAQVKSAILLAGLFVPQTELVLIKEPLSSRDHTERMLKAFGVDITHEYDSIVLKGRHTDLKAHDVFIPGDISSAAFWLVGSAIMPGSRLCIRHVGLNPLRLGIINILKKTGFLVDIDNLSETAGEPYGDLIINNNQPLKGNICITKDIVPSLIDEIPILTILGLFTDGMFTLQGAEELRFKESDRLNVLINILQTLGIDMELSENGFSFQGNPEWVPPQLETLFKTHHDHRIVMALEILNLKAARPFNIEGKEWVAISYPSFYQTLEKLISAK